MAIIKQAEAGIAAAQFNLGWMYHDGKGVAQDYTQACVWFEKAAAQGNADAQCCLGDLYANGKGVIQNHAQASLWYEKAATQGNADAQTSLGEMYLDGKGVGKDDAQARAWFEKAAAQGDSHAEFMLGTIAEREFFSDFGDGDFGQGVEDWCEKLMGEGKSKAEDNITDPPSAKKRPRPR